MQENTEEWREPKYENYLNDSSDKYYSGVTKSKHHQLERGNFEYLLHEPWYENKERREFEKSSSFNKIQPVIMPQTPSSPCDSTSSTIINSYPNSNYGSVNGFYRTPSFHRYSRSNDSEVDFNSLEQKRQKMMQYQQELAAQKYEKEQREKLEKERLKREDELAEKRFREQQMKLQYEYEEEQRKFKERQEAAEKKRLAVVAAIEKTPILKKKTFFIEKKEQNNNQENETSFQPVIATVLPRQINDECSEIDLRRNLCDVAVQTDHYLLFKWFDKMNKHKQGNINVEVESSSSNNSSPVLIPRSSKNKYKVANVYNSKMKIESNKQIIKENGFIPPNKFYMKNSDKDIGRKLLKSKCLTKSNEQAETKLKIEENLKFTSTNSINQRPLIRQKSAFNNQPQMNLNHRLDFLKQKRNSFSPISDFERAIFEESFKSKFLPDINNCNDGSARPHSRKKWHSQEAFYPSYK